MRESHKKLLSEMDYVQSNAAWKWQVEHLQSQIRSLKHVLIESGILVDVVGNIKQSVVVLDGTPYSIIREKK